jgi:hypothetical protein
MPQQFPWTPAQDARIRRLRAEGTSWDVIAADLGLNRWAVLTRGRRIGARLPAVPSGPRAEDLDREPLPAGDDRSWGALTKGTVLEGQPYPLPHFRR